MTRALPPLVLAALVAALLAAAPPGGAAGEPPALPDGSRLIEATAGSVNGEVLFLSDVVLEACLYRCGALPDGMRRETTLEEARDRLVADTLVIQEQRKLGLGAQDNAVIEAVSAEAIGRMDRCADPCARVYRTDDVRAFVARRILVEDFLRQRVGAFVEVEDEEVAREIERRRSREEAGPEGLREEEVRKELFDEKMARARRNWFDRATSKSRIVLSPLEER